MDNINPSATTNYLTPSRSGGAASRRSSGTGSSSVAVPATSIDAVLSWMRHFSCTARRSDNAMWYEIPEKPRGGSRDEHPLLSFNVVK